LPDGWRRTKRRYCSNPCKLDGYALRRAKALLAKVGIIEFHRLLDRAFPAGEGRNTYSKYKSR
jgi:hypothetical protein